MWPGRRWSGCPRFGRTVGSPSLLRRMRRCVRAPWRTRTCLSNSACPEADSATLLASLACVPPLCGGPRVSLLSLLPSAAAVVGRRLPRLSPSLASLACVPPLRGGPRVSLPPRPSPALAVVGAVVSAFAQRRTLAGPTGPALVPRCVVCFALWVDVGGLYVGESTPASTHSVIPTYPPFYPLNRGGKMGGTWQNKTKLR